MRHPDFAAVRLLLAGSLAAGCSSAYSPAYGDRGSYEAEAASADYGYSSDSVEGDVARPTTASVETVSRTGSYSKSAPPPRPAQRPQATPSRPGPQSGTPSPSGGKPAEPGAEPTKPDKQAARMVVYRGDVQLRVRRQLEAMEQLGKLAKDLGGFVQAQSGNVIILRVPVAVFSSALQRVGEAGEILHSSYSAEDIGDRVAELSTRLQVVQEARARLLELLARAKDPDERLALLEEIKRLTEQVETLQATLETLGKLAAFSTITVTLQPILTGGGSSGPRSYFGWVRELVPQRATLDGDKDDLRLPMPKGFVQFSKDDALRAQAADTSILRGGRVRNEPEGTARFWADAIAFEMDGRDEEKVDQYRAGPLEVQVFRNKDAQPRWYVVGVAVAGKHVYVVEAFLPTEAAWKEHGDAIRAALAKLEVVP